MGEHKLESLSSEERQKKIERIIKEIHELPTLPTTYAQLSKVISNPQSSAQQVSSIIEKDQALTAKILKIVNSAFYGFPQKISTISHSVVILGFNEIRHLTLAVSIIDLFKEKDGSHQFDYESFWQHSLAVAVCARTIAKRVGPIKIADPETAFTAGLIHDIGKLVEDQFIHNDFVQVLKKLHEKPMTILTAEEEVMGITHQQIGEILGRKWNLPLSLCGVIGHHNTPKKIDDKKNFHMIAVVHLANILVRAMNIGSGGDPYLTTINTACWEALELKKGHIEVIMEETTLGYQEVADLLIS